MTTRLTAHYIEISARAVNPDAAPADKIRLFLDDSGIVSYIDEAGNVTELAGNAVRYDMPQGLGPDQRLQARQNILAEQLGAAAAVTLEQTRSNNNAVDGPIDFSGNALEHYTVREVSATIDTTHQIDLSQATLFILTVSGDVTITFTNPPAPPLVGSVTVFLIQANGGGHSIAFSGARWHNGTAPNLAAAEGTETDLTFVIRDSGNEIRGYVAAEEMG
jgi:hypothetical protein